MHIRFRLLTSCLIWALISTAIPAFAGKNMIGNQSQNEGIRVLPASPQVAIDGDLSEWDWSARNWVFSDTAVRDQYSVEISTMWDSDNLYLAMKWKDPTPMFSAVDPDITPNDGWRSDAVQLRFAGDKYSHVTLWYFTEKNMPVFDIQYGQGLQKPFGGEGAFWTGTEDGTQLEKGIESAYKKDTDGQGFIHEVKIPWAVLYDTVPDWEGGDTFRMGMEFLWGDDTGGIKHPIHRYADNMQPGQTSREFFWTATGAWGDAVLLDQGDVPVREYVPDVAKITGTVPVRVQIPVGVEKFTLVIETPDGTRVRNLAGDADPAVYGLGDADADGMRTMEVMWDCLDDDGKLVAPGSYHVRGLTREGLSATYEMCFYNPGTPPWETKDGSGGWGADHCPPSGVSSGAGWTYINWHNVEGGAGIIGIDPQGNKQWENHRGIDRSASDDQYVYAYVVNWYVPEALCRFEATTGEPAPWEGRAFDCLLTDLLKDPEPGKIEGIAVHGGTLALAMSTGTLVLLDASTGNLVHKLPAEGLSRLAFSDDGILYGLVNGDVVKVDTEKGMLIPVQAAGLGDSTALTVDGDGNILVADMGPDSQIKAFSPKGELVYTLGQKGGRPLEGIWEPEGLVHVSSIAVDSREHVWVVEDWEYPRRVTVFDKEGNLLREYIGNTGYAGTGTYLHDQEADLAYVGTVELKLNHDTHDWSVSRVLWVPPADREYNIQRTHNNPYRFRSEASGTSQEYLYLHDEDISWGTGHMVLIEKGDRFQPVARIALVGQISGKISRRNGMVLEEPSGEFAGLNVFDSVIWNDSNDDGKIQRNECIIIPAKVPATREQRGRKAMNMIGRWGGRMGPDLSIYLTGQKGVTRWKPVRYTPSGAPVYSPDHVIQLSALGITESVPLQDGKSVLGRTAQHIGAYDADTGEVFWTYPNPYDSVHGSHKAPMPQPGMVIGSLKNCGTAYINDTVGTVALIRGNLGQDFLFTSDGLYVGAMFADVRLPGSRLPNSEDALRGMPMTTFSQGSEPFNGWFGKQDDGVIRMLTGIPRQAAMILQVHGLDSIRRFQGNPITLDPAILVKADGENTARMEKTAEPKSYTIAKHNGHWNVGKSIQVGREGQPESAQVKLAYDDQNLYARFEVKESSPWKNAGKDFARLFKTGDAVDIQLGTGTDQDPKGGDLRVVMAPRGDEAAAVLMKPVATNATSASAKAYTSPIGTRTFDKVEVLPDAVVDVKTSSNQYTVEATIPWSSLEITPKSGLALRGDVGFILSDSAGRINVARTYWANRFTNLVSDEPSEAWFSPKSWGTLILE